ncbi:MAG: DUF4404 family protein [Lentisphaeraceae bacterium]|nr:DUF4404 family protein [Lentisphaeraceae bacterium]
MVEDKLNKIEEKISQSENMTDENKAQVLELLKELKGEISSESSATEDTGIEKNISEIDSENEGFIKSAFNDINETINDFEESHPKLVQIVNSICTQLSNSGF